MYDPTRYENNKSIAAADITKFVPLLIENMTWGQKNENILDYGCGAGSTGFKYFLPKAEFLDSHLYSMDISEDMVAYAKANYSSSRTTYAVGDIMSDTFPFNGIKFDKIFSIHVLHYIKNYREALKRFYDLLKPGGQLGFTVASKSFVYKFYETLGKSEKWGKYMTGYEKYIPEWFEQNKDVEEAFRKNLEIVGFEVVKLDTSIETYRFQVDVLVEFILSLNPFIKVIPKELHADIKQEYRRLVSNYWNVKPDADEVEINHEIVYAIVEKPMEVY